MLGFRGGTSVAAVSRDRAAYMTKESSSETIPNPAAKGHGEHRPISETELGRKSFNPDWYIFREL